MALIRSGTECATFPIDCARLPCAGGSTTPDFISPRFPFPAVAGNQRPPAQWRLGGSDSRESEVLVGGGTEIRGP